VFGGNSKQIGVVELINLELTVMLIIFCSSHYAGNLNGGLNLPPGAFVISNDGVLLGLLCMYTY